MTASNVLRLRKTRRLLISCYTTDNTANTPILSTTASCHLDFFRFWIVEELILPCGIGVDITPLDTKGIAIAFQDLQ